MTPKTKQPDFGRWAVIGVVAPAVTIFVLRFFIAPYIWDEELAGRLGGALWMIFVFYLICLVGVAAYWKTRLDRKHNEIKTTANKAH